MVSRAADVVVRTTAATCGEGVADEIVVVDLPATSASGDDVVVAFKAGSTTGTVVPLFGGSGDVVIPLGNALTA